MPGSLGEMASASGLCPIVDRICSGSKKRELYYRRGGVCGGRVGRRFFAVWRARDTVYFSILDAEWPRVRDRLRALLQ